MSKKIIRITVAVVLVLAAVAALVIKFHPASVAGVYYSQKDSGSYIQIKADGSFMLAYNPKKDETSTSKNDENVQAYIDGTGTWSKDKDTITLTYTDGSTTELVILKDCLYNKNYIYKGVVTDALAFSQIFTYRYENKENRYDSLMFFEDHTVYLNKYRGGRPSSRAGTYTRLDDIITVRYNDEDNRAHEFLMVEGGITDDIYTKN